MHKVFTGLKTPHWELEVWSVDVSLSQQKLEATMKSRDKKLPQQAIRVLPIAETTLSGQPPIGEPPVFTGGPPVFFENQNYEFIFRFEPGCEKAQIRHRSQRVKDVFRFEKPALRGLLNFGNDIGWFSLTIVAFGPDERQHIYTVELEVHTSKLDVATDMEQMLALVDSTYPLWRFSYARTTEQGMDRKRKRFDRFPLIWLEQFKSLREELEQCVELVCNAPHHRLQQTSQSKRLEQLHGKLPVKREEAVAVMLTLREYDRRLTVTKRRLAVDTPENRFVRSVLEHCDRELGRLQQRVCAVVQDSYAGPSYDALREIAGWRKGIRDQLSNRLWREVGRFRGMQKESLVLHGRAGYSGVYRVWQQLRMYLDVLGRHSTISMKAISELYEIWCFLEVRRHLLLLGFKDENFRPPKLRTVGLEAELDKDGMGAAFQMQRGELSSGDLVKLRLAHEPLFGARERNRQGKRVVSWLNLQKPDIVIEATFPDGEILFWVFDAKYRIRRNDDSPSSSNDDGTADDDPAPAGDMAPADAINQMHRYRDAIIQAVSEEGSYPHLSRPVIGAFCLFPGWYTDEVQLTRENPYRDAIEAVGIGAFPLLPGQANPWLTRFLTSQLGEQKAAMPRSPGPEWQLAQWAPRTGATGLDLRTKRSLVFIAHIGGHRTPEYLQRISDGTAGWFHVRDEALLRGAIAASAMLDITHCAIAWPKADGTGSHITHYYQVTCVEKVGRKAITSEQSGTDIHGSDGRYWLLKLSQSERLAEPLAYKAAPRFRAWITGLETFETAKKWEEIATDGTCVDVSDITGTKTASPEASPPD